ncbi:Ankyrin repeat domain-containing protein 50, partial [Globisporangium splendens]
MTSPKLTSRSVDTVHLEEEQQQQLALERDERQQTWFAAAEVGDVVTMAHVLAQQPELIQTTTRLQGMNATTTALQVCVWRNEHKAVEWLLDAGHAEIDTTDEHGVTALMIELIRVGIEKMFPFPLLRSRRINVNSNVENSETPLLLAIGDGLIKHVQILLAHGADVFVHDPHGRSTLEIACEYGYTDIAQELITKAESLVQISGERALRRGVCHDFPGVLELLVHRVMQVLASDEERTKLVGRLLHLAVEHDAPACVEHILRVCSIDVNWRNSEEEGGQTAVHLTCIFRRSEILRILLQNGANADLCCDDRAMSSGNGYSPYHLAILHHGEDQISLLAQHGANINLLDQHHDTPLALAVKTKTVGRERMAQLIRHGAKFVFPTSASRDQRPQFDNPFFVDFGILVARVGTENGVIGASDDAFECFRCDHALQHISAWATAFRADAVVHKLLCDTLGRRESDDLMSSVSAQ